MSFTCVLISTSSAETFSAVFRVCFRKRPHLSTRWRLWGSHVFCCCTTASPRPCGTGSSSWRPSTLPSRCPSTSASSVTTRGATTRHLSVAAPYGATWQWRCFSCSVTQIHSCHYRPSILKLLAILVEPWNNNMHNFMQSPDVMVRVCDVNDYIITILNWTDCKSSSVVDVHSMLTFRKLHSNLV